MCAVKLGLLHNCSFCPHNLICRIGTRDGLETQAAGVEYAAATRLLLLHWQSSVQCNTGEFKWSRWWGSVTEPQAVFISDSSNHNLGGMLKKKTNYVLPSLSHFFILSFESENRCGQREQCTLIHQETTNCVMILVVQNCCKSLFLFSQLRKGLNNLKPSNCNIKGPIITPVFFFFNLLSHTLMEQAY